MRKFGLGSAILLALLIAACGTDSADPTAQPATEAPPSPAATTAPTIPPTWTPSTAPNSAAGGEQAGEERTLPPTWTPRAFSQPTASPAPTTNPPTQPPRPTFTPLPDWCNALQALEAPDTSITGHPVHLRWAELENVSRYRVELISGTGMPLVSEVVDATEYTVPGDLFAMPGVYGWEVTPVDDGGADVCFAISNEIVVRVPPD